VLRFSAAATALKRLTTNKEEARSAALQHGSNGAQAPDYEQREARSTALQHDENGAEAPDYEEG